MKIDIKLVGLVLLGVIFLGQIMSDQEDKIVFLDVGQGDAILLQSGRTQILVDGGQGMEVLRGLGEELPWFDKKIEVVILTHPQRDHMEGLLHVLERYDVELVILPNVTAATLMQEEWLERVQSVPYFRFARAGQKITAGEIEIDILGPLNSPASLAAIKSDVNNASVIARVEFGELSLLLTGDMEARAEKLLVNEYGSEPGGILDTDILKVGHHGSKSSTSDKFLAAVSPSAAVISVGEDNRFKHPHPDVLARLEGLPIFRTDEQGAITMQLVKGEWVVNFQ